MSTFLARLRCFFTQRHAYTRPGYSDERGWLPIGPWTCLYCNKHYNDPPFAFPAAPPAKGDGAK